MITKSFLIAMSTLLLTACPDSNKANAQQKPTAPVTVKSATAKAAPKDVSTKPFIAIFVIDLTSFKF